MSEFDHTFPMPETRRPKARPNQRGAIEPASFEEGAGLGPSQPVAGGRSGDWNRPAIRCAARELSLTAPVPTCDGIKSVLPIRRSRELPLRLT